MKPIGWWMLFWFILGVLIVSFCPKNPEGVKLYEEAREAHNRHRTRFPQ